ncbi:MAG: hypothetical protein ACI9FJ_000840 [Alteromonadaceae bacterium]
MIASKSPSSLPFFASYLHLFNTIGYESKNYLTDITLVKANRWGNEVWVNHISKQEMPTQSSTIRILESLANDDIMSLAKLGQSVLHDYALTSSILKVANSSVYFHLLKLMAQSFHAGMLSQMLMPDPDDTTKEKTFIITLLHHLGDLFIRSLEDPDLRSPQLKIASLADRLSVCIANPGNNAKQLNDLIKEFSKMSGCAEILRELTFLTAEKGDFNVVIQTALEGGYRGIGMDRVIVLLKGSDKKTLVPRFFCGQNSE